MKPVVVSDTDRRAWLKPPPIAFNIALAWRRYGPRAKSAIARLVGRTIGRRMRTTVTLASGALLAVDPANLDIFMDIVVNKGFWDEHVTRWLAKVIRPGDVVYDIGANAGALSIDVASRFKDKIKLVAIEPIPSLAENVARSATMNELSETVQVFDVMLGDEEGKTVLHIPSHAIHASAFQREPGSTPLEREIHRLDDLVRRGALPPPDVVKIDVEGGELAAFRGALETFKAHPPVILFEADWNMERCGYSRADLLAALRDAHAGYRFYYLAEASGQPRLATDENEPISDDTGNMIAVPEGRALALD